MRHAFAGLNLLACGPAVRRMLTSLGHEPLAEVLFGPEHGAFGLDVAVESRSAVVGFPVREEAFKGAWDAIVAVSLMHLQRPDLQICAFGRIPLPFAPAWLDYSFRPSDTELRQFYNRLAIFLHPSHYEAWPLPPLEAMTCGASLLAADSVGVLGYAHDGHNATVVPAGRPDLLAQAAYRLLDDDARRIRLARQGRLDANHYRWSRAVSDFEQLITTGSSSGRPH
jgi:glycosyltransferase involved in cell wall biosynthesis